jgi:hypothetical protein
MWPNFFKRNFFPWNLEIFPEKSNANIVKEYFFFILIFHILAKFHTKKKKSWLAKKVTGANQWKYPQQQTSVRNNEEWSPIGLFCGENSPFCYERKVSSNMIKVTFWKKNTKNSSHFKEESFVFGKDLGKFLGFFLLLKLPHLANKY